MINRIYIDNFRSFTHFEYIPDRFQLLLGENGSGKTSLFDVLESLRDVITKGDPVDSVFEADTLCKWRADNDGRQEFQLGIDSGAGQFDYSLVVEHDAKRARNRITAESLTYQSVALFKFDGREVHLYRDDGSVGPAFPFDWTRSGIATIPARDDNRLLSLFRTRLSNLNIFSPDPLGMEAVAKKAIARADRSMHNFASWLFGLQSDDFEIGARVSNSLQECINGFSKHRFPMIGSNTHELFVDFEFRFGDNDQCANRYELSFDALSEGQRNLFAIYTVLHGAVKDGSTVCIDEPDNFVALREIQPWLSALQDQASDTGSQVFLISHHPELINQLAANCGQYFYRDESGDAATRRFEWSDASNTTPAEIVARGWE